MDYEKILNMIAQTQQTLDEIKHAIQSETQKPQTTLPSQAKPEKPVFPHELEGLVKIEDTGQFWTLTPVKFLDSENFTMILNITKDYGGKYQPWRAKGQPGHFEIPK